MSGNSGDAAAVLPPLSEVTLAEFESNTTGDIWNELLVLARQPGVVNLGQGYPDYDGSKVAREAAAEAMVDPAKVHNRCSSKHTVDNTRCPSGLHRRGRSVNSIASSTVKRASPAYVPAGPRTSEFQSAALHLPGIGSRSLSKS